MKNTGVSGYRYSLHAKNNRLKVQIRGVSLYTSANDVSGITAWRTSGPYKGGGFAMYYQTGTADLKTNTLYCIERKTGPNAIQQRGIYCENIMKAQYVGGNPNLSYHYLMP